MNEEVMAMEWVRDALEADAELAGSVNTFALRSTKTSDPLPYIKIDRLDAHDVMGVGIFRVWNDMTLLVRGITQGPEWTEVKAIANRIDTVLHGARGGMNDEVVVEEIVREETFSEETVESGDLYLHAGGIYRVRAKAL
jgi:hypothetical protein